MDNISKIRTLLDMARQALAYHINEAEQRHEKERLIRPDRNIVVRINAALEGPVADYERERDEARAEVERLRADIGQLKDLCLSLYGAACPGLSFMGKPPEPMVANVKWSLANAYQRGAEAMREAAAREVLADLTLTTLTPVARKRVVRAIRALPVPEDK